MTTPVRTDPIEKNATEARQGENSRRMPVVLAASILLVVAIFATVYGFASVFGAHQ